MKKENAKALILYIEDDTVISEMYAFKFENDGYDLRMARNGREGLRVAAKEKPDLILLDIIMEEMDGIETLKRLKVNSMTRYIPVVMLTNLDSEAIMKQVKDLGAVNLWVKTKMTPSQVLDGVKKILEK